jgi:predicted nucleic acid-binding protein
MINPVAPSLLDTDAMLAIANHRAAAVPFWLAINRLGRPRYSRLTALAMLAGCPSDADRALVLRYIATSTLVEVTDAIALRAADILTAAPLPTTLTAIDAIVASTAIEHSLPLYTLDPARFAAVPGLTALRPY